MKPSPAYPPPFRQKVLSQEAPGGPPATIEVVIPTVTRPDKPFEAKVAVLDDKGYPSLQCDGPLTVSVPGQDSVETGLTSQPGVPAVGSLQNVRIPDTGIWRLHAAGHGLQADSNPTLCTSEDVPDIRWGDPHVHTVLSRCHADTCRSLTFCFTAARYCTFLDWVAAADHVSNGRCDFSKWKEQQTAANAHNDEPFFATLPAYEASLKGGAGGDNNVYMLNAPEIFIDEFEDGNAKTLCDKLAATLPADQFFVVPHHTTRTGKHGEIPDEIYPGPEQLPVIEIHSKWGTSEYRGNPNPLKQIHPGPSYVVDLLNRGMKFGFVAGTDTHATMPSGAGEEPGHIDRLPGLTAVCCSELTRRGIFDSMRRRQCYATSLERILLHGSVAGADFGAEVPSADLKGPPVTDVLVAAKSDITRIDLVRNGETIHTTKPDAWQARFRHEDGDDLIGLKQTSVHTKPFVYYYLRVTCKSGAQAWSSPVWITG